MLYFIKFMAYLLIASSIAVVSSPLLLFADSGNGKGGEWRSPLDSWDYLELPSTDFSVVPSQNPPEHRFPVYPRDAIRVYDHRLIYADRKLIEHPFMHWPIPTDPKDRLLSVELFLRYIDDIPFSVDYDDDTNDYNNIYGHLPCGVEDYPFEEMSNISISSLGEYFGKLYVGISARQGYDEKAQESYDTHRNKIYIIKSVDSGVYLSKPIEVTVSSNNLLLSLDGILPGCKMNSIVERSKYDKTSVGVQVKFANNLEELNRMQFRGPSGENSFFSLKENERSVKLKSPARWYQVKIVLTTKEPRLSPVLTSIEIKSNKNNTISKLSDWQLNID